MTVRNRLVHTLFFSIALLFLACAPERVFRSADSAPPSLPPENGSHLTAADTADAVDDDDLKDLPLDAAFMVLPVTEKLAVAARMLESARKLLSEDQLVTAGYRFAMVRVILTSINVESLDAERETYQRLAEQIDHFYDDYVRGKDELPAESPREAVIAGVEVSGEDTLTGDDGMVAEEDLAPDTTALAEALQVKVLYPPIPMVMNRQVENAIKFFQTKGRKVYQRWLGRAEVYEPMMRKILREEGMPEDLVYIAMIESGFNPIAYSYAHASGPWQFIKSTGKIFGLKTTYWHDERRDPVKATYAAVRYFKKLYYDFDDWYLAMAAYNCGERNVEKNIHRSGTKDFWKMSRLPKQTRNYVPTYIAARLIAQDPAAYGFDPPVFRDLPKVDSMWVTEQVDLKLAARLIGREYQELKEINPWLLRACTPPTNDSTLLILPVGTAEAFQREWAALPDDEKRALARHTVRKGETLSAIARKYGVSVRDIRAIAENQIRPDGRLRIGQELIVPTSPEIAKARYTAVEEETPPAPARAGNGEVVHIVRSGETPAAIAARYGVSASSLMKRNHISNPRRLRVGQRLVVKPGATPAVAAAPETEAAGVRSNRSEPVETSSTAGAASRTHIVAKGETPQSIASRYGISAAALMKSNGISDPRKMKVGARLKVPGAGEVEVASADVSSAVHTVRRGDTIWDIARRYGIERDHLLRANDLDHSSRIRPGDRLVIPR